MGRQKIADLVDGMNRRRDIGRRIRDQRVNACADDLRRHHRFVTLQINHYVVIRPAQTLGNFVNAVGS